MDKWIIRLALAVFLSVVAYGWATSKWDDVLDQGEQRQSGIDSADLDAHMSAALAFMNARSPRLTQRVSLGEAEESAP